MPRKILSQRNFSTPPVAKLIGFHLVQAGKGKAVCRMRTGKKHLNTIGTIHGGILCDLADAAMGFAFLSLLPSHQTGVTIEFKINFLKPVFPGDLIRASAKTLFLGKSLFYLECELSNARGKLIAKASSTCKKVSEEN
ncbi:MAG: DUF4442 domain-containing protein [Candidatus Omnitrophica bacterium CG11_big_fil_rev_8_21_14_0_20_45_26]|uniref:DUF4442 domain-containing protein n=1 Tax=Candidatus Abzuiibacterium crystallinum TaxID=1974748 RepID=A0A2H0LPT6_9BACT|nr:MAG: DUF4442 domain-containing protein [Candidatus Omnitrophica bacterium CG11_big_fil_rev_8_21_14_0_20_45_26]PIW63586.1 MAG: PaaI family thioesterase [Candidatus Omnitrophica bacterium CG12_big_fil_rev_8_21_14_0_65_45_16]